MGHTRLGTLPRTKPWNNVADLVAGSASAEAVVAATLDAAQRNLAVAADDPVLRRTFWLLTQLPTAALDEDFGRALQSLGLDVSDAPSAIELTAGFSQAIDRFVATTGRSRAGELAQMSAVETLTSVLRDRTANLFGATAADVKREVGKLATEKQFGLLARTFFARFMDRFLNYFISRELPLHVGQGRRFLDRDAEKEFNEALALHCQQAAEIIESFAGAWYSKARFERDLSEERTAGFLGYSLKKLRSELQRMAA